MIRIPPSRSRSKMRLPLMAMAVLCAAMSASAATARLGGDAKALRVYFVDVEGGQATLFVTPRGESLLIDTGWPGNQGRDADRIVAAAKSAGLDRINYVLITHFHVDHVGGVPQLIARIPVDTFVDHGENHETGDLPTVQGWQAYHDVLATKKFHRITAKPGDILPIRGMKVSVVSSDGALIQSPEPGAGRPNPSCAISEHRDVDQTENLRSLGVLISFGKLKILDLGDLTWDKEMELMCPLNKLGRVDVYIVSHHGWFHSGSPALVHGMHPRIAIMDNGQDKGGSPAAWDIIEKSPHLENLWQLHFSSEGGAAHNVAEPFIANTQGADQGNFLQLTGHTNGSFEIFNSRTQDEKKYSVR